MKYKVAVGISNHHVHVTEEVYYQLFNEAPTKKCDIKQIGEYACNEVVTIKSDKAEIRNVRVMGPFREYNQVEISRTDAIKLGICPPVRRSGDLENSETITLVSEKASVTLENACIIANRHVHMNPEKALELGVVDNQLVKLEVKGEKACLLDAYTKISDNGVFEVHLDFDDANAAGLNSGDEIDIIL